MEEEGSWLPLEGRPETAGGLREAQVVRRVRPSETCRTLFAQSRQEANERPSICWRRAMGVRRS